MSYVIYLADASASVGTVITYVVVFLSEYFGIDPSRNLWVLAIPLVSSLSLNVLLLELYGRYRRDRSQPLRITTPKDGSTVIGRRVTIAVKVTHFRIVNKIGEASVSGQGHVHFYKDLDITNVRDKPTNSAPSTYEDVPGTAMTWEHVEAGLHTFCAHLVNNDHTPLAPPIVACVTVTVK